VAIGDADLVVGTAFNLDSGAFAVRPHRRCVRDWCASRTGRARSAALDVELTRAGTRVDPPRDLGTGAAVLFVDVVLLAEYEIRSRLRALDVDRLFSERFRDLCRDEESQTVRLAHLVARSGLLGELEVNRALRIGSRLRDP
jgi:hypothetical protein